MEMIEKEFILEQIKEIGQQERHFNVSTLTLKSLASTWLLASFGAIGFVLKEQTLPNKEALIIGICIACSIGIFLLWIVDIIVYQRLLSSCFHEGLKLENKYNWLPRVRNNMKDSQIKGRGTTSLVWYYVFGINIPLFIAFVASIYLCNELIEKLSALFIGGIAIMLLNKFVFKKSNEPKKFSKT